jgi:hypothetical protein
MCCGWGWCGMLVKGVSPLAMRTRLRRDDRGAEWQGARFDGLRGGGVARILARGDEVEASEHGAPGQSWRCV